jgi:lipooligosaccharide transport system ATP-binding protein
VARERIDEALALFQLQDRAKELVENLSGGMKRRLSIARALVSEPKILVLDEPTTGLDPQARHLVWQKLRLLKAQGVTMLLSTHNMEEATHLCDRIIIMHLGRILAQGPPADLIVSHVGEEVLELQARDPEEKARALQRLSNLDGVTVEDVEDMLFVLGLGPHGPQVASELLDQGYQARLRHATLEDVFLRLTGRGLTE